MQDKRHNTEQNHGLGEKLSEKLILAEISKQILKQTFLDREA